jgi:hypothetical protein
LDDEAEGVRVEGDVEVVAVVENVGGKVGHGSKASIEAAE